MEPSKIAAAPAGANQPAPGKNIVLLCDGTANQVTIYSQTNVLRLARLLQKGDGAGGRQVVFYDPGLGTEGSPGALTWFGRAITRGLGLAFGFGLSRNLADAYSFLVQHYEPGDRIYIFGFSRGAYTARALTGLLGRVGLLERGCESLISYAIRYFHACDDHQLNFFKQRFSRTYPLLWQEVIPGIADGPLRDRAKKPSRGVVPVHFLGVWDTVKSIGLFRRRVSLPDTDWLPNMIYGRHAVALDERRSQYRPELWCADTGDPILHAAEQGKRKANRQSCLHQDVETVWFAGAHSDVGGGYGLPKRRERELIRLTREGDEIDFVALPKARAAGRGEDEARLKARRQAIDTGLESLGAVEAKETGLAHCSLRWMIDAAQRYGLLFDALALGQHPPTPDPAALLHNPLLPAWWLVGWRRRRLPGGARLDASVGLRQGLGLGYEPAARP